MKPNDLTIIHSCHFFFCVFLFKTSKFVPLSSWAKQQWPRRPARGLISKQSEINGRSERLTWAEDDTHSHSFMGLGGCARTRRNDSLGIQRQLWPNDRGLFDRGDQLSISGQAAEGRRGWGARLIKLSESCWQINLADPVNECTWTNAFGFDTGHCRNSD